MNFILRTWILSLYKTKIKLILVLLVFDIFIISFVLLKIMIIIAPVSWDNYISPDIASRLYLT